MIFHAEAERLLERLNAAQGNVEQQVGDIATALIRAQSEACRVCATGYGNGRGTPDVRCAICRGIPETIVCMDCARATRAPSWGE